MDVKVVTVVGARPQFVKAAAVSRAIARRAAGGGEPRIVETLVHTGQHYDDAMSGAFFAELELPAPKHHLGVGSASHGAQTAGMLRRLEPVLTDERPDVVLVYGDTNSTLAGALAAAKLGMPIAHVEAGLRSFNRAMAEEINRVVTDRLATWLFCPSGEAVRNLDGEGIRANVHEVGDVMYDVLRWQLARSAAGEPVLDRLGLAPREYALATVHRAENTDDPARLRAIVDALERLARAGLRIVLPLHPRTRHALERLSLGPKGVALIPPASYEDMVGLEASARVVLTDSGGVQKEAYWLGVPCVTLRDETEWVETVAAGWNRIVGADADAIVAAALRPDPPAARPALYGEGEASDRILAHLVERP